MKALIDADLLVYQAGFAAQQTLYRFCTHNDTKIMFERMPLKAIKQELADAGHSAKTGALQRLIKPESATQAARILQNIINPILEEVQADDYVFYLTDNKTKNFRYEVAKTKPYKGTRSQHRPVHYDMLRDYIVEHYAATIAPHIEADDAIGIDSQKEESIIVSIDKDLDMLPGVHYNFNKKKFYTTVDPGELFLTKDRKKIFGGGLKWFYAQLLLGDTSDNIPGINGYGPVGTYDALKDVHDEISLLTKVYAIYKERAVQKRLLEVVDLLWIRRIEDEMKSESIKSLLEDIDSAKDH